MTRNNFLFFLILLLSFFLRFFYLGKVPNGFYSDEAAYGYNAYSLMSTGKDEYGNFFPIAFKSFGDYKAPLYIYLLVPFVKTFGLSEISVRMVSALLGVLLVIIVYFLTKELFKYNSHALLSSYFISLMPFSLQFNRIAHENNLVVVLITGGILLFFLSFRYRYSIILSFISFVGSIYTYHDAKIFTPFILMVLFILFHRNLWDNKKNVLIGILVSIIFLIPFIRTLQSDVFWSRPRYTHILSDNGLTLEVNQEREENQQAHFLVPSLFHNKIFAIPKRFLENYLSQYSLSFLFLTGDPVKIYQTPSNGLFYPILIPFFLWGIYCLLKKSTQDTWFIFMWLFLAGVPPALTRFVPSASRMFLLLPVASILFTVGLLSSFTSITSFFGKRGYLIFLAILFTMSIAYYLHYYYFNMPVRYAKEWHYGMQEVISQVKAVENKYASIWFSKNTWGYIYPLFYLSYSPEQYQKQAKLSALNEFGFGWVSSFDKFTFGDFPPFYTLKKDTLFIGSPSDFSEIKKPLYTIYYPNGEEAFYFADTDSF